MIGVITAGLFSTGAPPVSPTSYESIATYTLGSAQSSVTFSSIPSTFKHLQIRAIQATTTTDDDIECRFNSDTGSNYSVHRLRGNGSAASSDGYANVTQFEVGRSPSAASAFGPIVFDVLDYADANKYKTGRSLFGSDGNGSGWIMLSSGNWRNTAAVTTIQLRPSAGGNTFVANSSFALYGIKG